MSDVWASAARAADARLWAQDEDRERGVEAARVAWLRCRVACHMADAFRRARQVREADAARLSLTLDHGAHLRRVRAAR